MKPFMNKYINKIVNLTPQKKKSSKKRKKTIYGKWPCQNVLEVLCLLNKFGITNHILVNPIYESHIYANRIMSSRK